MSDGAAGTTGPALAEASVRIAHAVGLHARPSVKLTQLAKTFEAAIRLRGGEAGAWVNAKSIVKVMALKVPEGETLFFKADGSDGAAAVAALVSLVERDFDEQGG